LNETSTLLITHRIDEAEKICDNIAIINEGCIIDQAPPNTLKERHGIVYVLQIYPSVTTSQGIEEVDRMIKQNITFCRKVHSTEQEEDESPLA
jgi:ABC-type multidrug transport system ATPase subunit